MDTTRLKRFATEARNKIRSGVERKLLSLGFDTNGETSEFPRQIQGATLYRGQQLEESFYDKWTALYEAIHRDGLKQVCEEVAYTWFNRLVAIRILHKNGFIDSVLSFDNPTIRVPHIVSEARKGRIPQMEERERLRLLAVLSDPIKTYDQFVLLIIAFCHATPVINNCFGSINDYTELLLPNDILDEGNLVDMLNRKDLISDEDYKASELIGWLYQFYIAEKKDEVFASFKNGKKAEAEDIPAATQIFTPNWIVKYMVQNTLGRIYLDNNPYETRLQAGWKYLVEPSSPSGKDEILRISELEEIKVADLSCGSGHILAECFDTLYDFYIAEGYGRTEAIESIFRHNLTGVDIDTRAKQLSQFALLLKACQKEESFVDAHVMPKVLDMPKVNRYTWKDAGDHFRGCYNMTVPHGDAQELEDAFTLMEEAENLGSIMKFKVSDLTVAYIREAIQCYEEKPSHEEAFAPLIDGFRLILALTEKYSAVVMNPPYMGAKHMEDSLYEYVKANYRLTSNDLGATFMDVAYDLITNNGKFGMINQATWFFKPIYKKYRESIITNVNYNLESALYLGPNTFPELKGEVVQSVAFVVSKSHRKHTNFFYLKSGQNTFRKSDIFRNGICKKYIENISNFTSFIGYQFGFWLSEDLKKRFKESPISKYGDAKQGLKTGNNSYFIRLWYEVSNKKCNKKWFPVETGGPFRKWYGNGVNVLNWENNGKEIKSFKNEEGKLKSRPQGLQYAFTDGITWSTSAGNNPSFRFSSSRYLFESSGSKFFLNRKDKNLEIFCAYLNSPVVKSFIEIFSPGLGISEGTINSLPYIDGENINENSAKENIAISREDWDAHETSWDFQENELLATGETSLARAMEAYKQKWEAKFHQLHQNEEELNRQFIEIYGLEEELTPDVPLDEVTILQQGEISIE